MDHTRIDPPDCGCTDCQMGHSQPLPGNTLAAGLPLMAYTRKFDEAARRANAAYLDGLAMWGGQRRHQEYDNLNESGKTVWRAVAYVVMQTMQQEG